MIFNNTSCSLSAQKQIADPVVYKLVRLEGDGRLVPATDDDFVEVENLLEDDNGEPNIVENPGSSPNEELSSRKPEFVGLEGSLHLQNTESEAKNSNMELEVLSLLEMASNQSVTVAECSNHSVELENNETSTSDVYVMPDFSKLKGELCLDNLSIRELHQTFKATFGRETSVKDKLWLKRRIAMGLTNSCNVSTTTFTIKDSRLVKTGDDESCHKVHNPSIVEISTDSPANQVNQIVHHDTISFKRARNPKIEHDCKTEDHNTENKAAKRARKPTRRYIEELSEGEGKEYSGRSMLTVNKSGYCQSSLKSPARSARNASSDGRAVVTRLDSLGGSGVQVPYVSRVRRGRPRENFMSLSKFHPSGRVAATSLKKAFNIGSAQPDNDSGNKVSKASSVPQQQLVV